ncbi:MAG: hypothetical protein ACT4P4_25805 [Betaproteobacteria bacterium]
MLVASVVAANQFDLYGRLQWFDMPMHLAGGIALAYFFRAWGCRRRVCFALAVIGALAWEMSELLADVWLGMRLTHGPSDTARDLLFSALGAALYVTLCALRVQRFARR